MKTMNARTLIIGFLLAAAVAICVGAASAPGVGRYSVTVSAIDAPDTIYVCVADTVTGKYAIGQCVKKIPASRSRIVPLGTFSNPLIGEESEDR